MQIQQKKIIWDGDDWLKGKAEQFETAVGNAGIMPGLTAMQNVNPFYKLGSITTSYKTIDIDDDEDLSEAQKSGKVYREGFIATSFDGNLVRTDLTTSITVPQLDTGTTDGVTWPYGINSSSANCTGEDTAVYNSNVSSTSTNTFFFSWKDDTTGSETWNVGRYDGVNGTIDDDFMSTVPTGSGDFDDTNYELPHPLEVGDDDVLYIGDGRYVHAYDGGQGTNGTFFEEVLTLPAGYVITAFGRVTDYLVVFAYKSNFVSGSNSYLQGTSKAFFWDYLNLDPTYIFDLNDNYVSEAVTFNSTVACFTRGRTNDLENPSRDCSLQLFTGSEFESVADWIGDVPIRGGSFVRDRAIWWNSQDRFSNSVIYAWGQMFRNLDNKFYQLHLVSANTSASGCLAQPTTRYLYVAGGAINAGYVNPNQFTSGFFTTQVAAPKFNNEHIGKAVSLKVNFAETTSTAVPDITLQVYNQDGDSVTLLSNDPLQITDSNISAQYNIEDFGNLFFNGAYVAVTWSENATDTNAQVIQSIELEYEPININNLE